MNDKQLAGFPPGVYPLTPAALSRLAETASKQGYYTAALKLSGCQDKTGLLERFAQTLGFPDWFGHNWDAFSDCLLDLDWLPSPGHVLLLSDCASFAQTYPAAWAEANAILRETIQQRARHDLPMWVFCDNVQPASEPAHR